MMNCPLCRERVEEIQRTEKPQMWRCEREAFEDAGIKYGREGDGLTLHSGRHTYASWLAQGGRPLNVIASLLGDTTKVVEDTYAHLVPDTFRHAVQHIEDLIGDK